MEQAWLYNEQAISKIKQWPSHEEHDAQRVSAEVLHLGKDASVEDITEKEPFEIAQRAHAAERIEVATLIRNARAELGSN